MFFIVLLESTHGREQLDKILKKSFVNFYFWGITLSHIRQIELAVIIIK